MESSNLVGLQVVAKFFMSKDPKDPKDQYKCISRTLGKLSIADSKSEMSVEDQEIWLCRILHETCSGKNYGVFILDPIEKVEPNSVKKLIPGFYYEPTAVGKTLIVKPKEENSYWMLSKETRKAYSERYHTIVVPHTFKEVVNESESKED